MNRYEVGEFKFNKLFNRLEVVDSRIKDGYVEYRIVGEKGKYRWFRRYELVWQYYKKNKRKFGYHIHHKNMNKLDDRPSNLVQITRKKHIGIHGIVYSVDGVGGSSGMLGRKHTQSTKDKMSKSMAGNKNSAMFRNEEWGKRIGLAQKRFGRNVAVKEKIMRKVVYKYCMEGKSSRGIAKELNVSRQVVDNRLKWFIEDNFDEEIGFPQMKWSLVDEDLSELVYYDELYEVDVEREIIRYKFLYLLSIEDVVAKLNLGKDYVESAIERFKVANGLEDMFNYQIRKFVVERGLDNIKSHN